jgi:hypothetical protein
MPATPDAITTIADKNAGAVLRARDAGRSVSVIGSLLRSSGAYVRNDRQGRLTGR